jgi:hypothetical protein
VNRPRVAVAGLLVTLLVAACSPSTARIPRELRADFSGAVKLGIGASAIPHPFPSGVVTPDGRRRLLGNGPLLKVLADGSVKPVLTTDCEGCVPLQPEVSEVLDTENYWVLRGYLLAGSNQGDGGTCPVAVSPKNSAGSRVRCLDAGWGTPSNAVIAGSTLYYVSGIGSANGTSGMALYRWTEGEANATSVYEATGSTLYGPVISADGQRACLAIATGGVGYSPQSVVCGNPWRPSWEVQPQISGTSLQPPYAQLGDRVIKGNTVVDLASLTESQNSAGYGPTQVSGPSWSYLMNSAGTYLWWEWNYLRMLRQDGTGAYLSFPSGIDQWASDGRQVWLLGENSLRRFDLETLQPDDREYAPSGWTVLSHVYVTSANSVRLEGTDNSGKATAAFLDSQSGSPVQPPVEPRGFQALIPLN